MIPCLVFCATATPSKKDYIDIENLLKSDLSKELAVAKLRINNVPLTRTQIYMYLHTVWENEDMQSFADFLKWYNHEDVVPH